MTFSLPIGRMPRVAASGKSNYLRPVGHAVPRGRLHRVNARSDPKVEEMLSAIKAFGQREVCWKDAHRIYFLDSHTWADGPPYTLADRTPPQAPPSRAKRMTRTFHATMGRSAASRALTRGEKHACPVRGTGDIVPCSV